MNWYLKVVKEHYADFSGRARRKEFWMFTLINALISWGLSFLFAFLAISMEMPGFAFISYIYTIAVFIPGLAVTIRRLHDIGKSGVFILIALIPIIGAIWLLVLLCMEGENKSNQWGENPKGIGNDTAINQIGRT
jgi:uncharacterized membrane protein YhaH (DUF805 family)